MKNIQIYKYEKIKTMPYNSKLIKQERIIDYENNTIKYCEIWQSNDKPKRKYTVEWETNTWNLNLQKGNENEKH